MLRKIITFVKAGDDGDRAALRRWTLAEAAPAILAGGKDIHRLIVNLVDVDPGDAEWLRPGEVRSAPTTPAYDVVIESWVAAGRETDVAAALASLFAPRAGRTWSYAATEWVQKENRKRAGPARSPGVKYLVQCRFFDDLPASAAQRSWAHHVKLALRVHVGMDIYIRNWIDASLTPGAPRVDGVGELHFPTVADMRERWFCSDHGRGEIVQDIGHFLQSGTRLYASEYVLR